MEDVLDYQINKDMVSLALIETKLSVNQMLYNQGAITEEMYIKTKEIVIKAV